MYLKSFVLCKPTIIKRETSILEFTKLIFGNVYMAISTYIENGNIKIINLYNELSKRLNFERYGCVLSNLILLLDTIFDEEPIKHVLLILSLKIEYISLFVL